MKVLVIYAHPNPKSFNHAVLEKFTKGLKDGGHTYEVLDLYASGFDPRIKLEDFAQFAGGQTPEDVVEQHKKVSDAEALAFIYPVVWGGPPGIVKGWLDRVFSVGFAYGPPAKGKMGPSGLLKQKKALIINTTLTPEEFYKATGIGDAARKMIDDYVLKGCGIQEVEHVFLYQAGMGLPAFDEARKRYLDSAYRLGKEF